MACRRASVPFKDFMWIFSLFSLSLSLAFPPLAPALAVLSVVISRVSAFRAILKHADSFPSPWKLLAFVLLQASWSLLLADPICEILLDLMLEFAAKRLVRGR